MTTAMTNAPDNGGIRHADDTYFVLHNDFKRLGKRYYAKKGLAFATTLRVLETRRLDRVKACQAAGFTDEEIAADPDLLWFDVTYRGCRIRAMEFYGERTFRAVLPEVVTAGFARQRYIKRIESRDVTNEAGQLIIYATYAEAVEDSAHPGDIIHQVLLLCEVINAAIDDMYGRPPTQPPPAPVPTPPEKEASKAQKSGGEQGENLTQSPRNERSGQGNNIFHQPIHSVANIPQRGQICQGVGTEERPDEQNCQGGSENTEPAHAKMTPPAGKNDNDPRQKCQTSPGKKAGNKNLNKNQQESEKESLIANSAERAVDILSHFDFSREWSIEAILDLAALLLPLKANYKTNADREAAELACQEAAAKLFAKAFLRKAGLRSLARLMAYFADPASPSEWRRRARATNRGVEARLWHVAVDGVAWHASREMLAANWWPAWLTPDIASAPEHVAPASATPLPTMLQEIDLAAIVNDRVPVGMDRDITLAYEAWLREALAPFDYFVQSRPLGPRHARRGYAIEVYFGAGQLLRFYSIEQWALIAQLDAQAQLGTPEFTTLLAEALRSDQVA